jgi:hypothetical protein
LVGGTVRGQPGDVAQGVWLAVVLLADAASFGAALAGLDPEAAGGVVVIEEDVSTGDLSPFAVPPVLPSSFSTFVMLLDRCSSNCRKHRPHRVHARKPRRVRISYQKNGT